MNQMGYNKNRFSISIIHLFTHYVNQSYVNKHRIATCQIYSLDMNVYSMLTSFIVVTSLNEYITAEPPLTK